MIDYDHGMSDIVLIMFFFLIVLYGLNSINGSYLLKSIVNCLLNIAIYEVRFSAIQKLDVHFLYIFSC